VWDCDVGNGSASLGKADRRGWLSHLDRKQGQGNNAECKHLCIKNIMGERMLNGSWLDGTCLLHYDVW
jgi:hypothetical protein